MEEIKKEFIKEFAPADDWGLGLHNCKVQGSVTDVWQWIEEKLQQEREDKLMDKAIDTYKPAIQALGDEEWPLKQTKGAWGKEKERHLSKHQEISDKIQKKWFEALNPKPINN